MVLLTFYFAQIVMMRFNFSYQFEILNFCFVSRDHVIVSYFLYFYFLLFFQVTSLTHPPYWGHFLSMYIKATCKRECFSIFEKKVNAIKLRYSHCECYNPLLFDSVFSPLIFTAVLLNQILCYDPFSAFLITENLQYPVLQDTHIYRHLSCNYPSD